MRVLIFRRKAIVLGWQTDYAEYLTGSSIPGTHTVGRDDGNRSVGLQGWEAQAEGAGRGWEHRRRKGRPFKKGFEKLKILKMKK